jgi:hypothetical protein
MMLKYHAKLGDRALKRREKKQKGKRIRET